MKKYNLIGQLGTEGTTNPKSPEGGPYIYDTPPGLGDNKGLSTVRGRENQPADENLHKKKLEEAGIAQEGPDFSQFSFGEKEQPDVSGAKGKVTNREFNQISSLDQIRNLAESRTFTDTQVNRLKGIYGVDVIDAIFKSSTEPTTSTTAVAPPNTRFPRNPKLTSNVTPNDTSKYSIFGEDAVFVASAIKSIEEKKVPKDLASAIRLLRNYDTVESVTKKEKENIETTKNESLNNLNNLLDEGTISQGEYNAFSKAIEEVSSDPEGKKKKVTTGGQTLYIVVGSPGNYTVKAVNPGDEGYESGMSLEAAQATANELNAGYEPEDGPPEDGPPSGGSTTTSTEVIDFNNVPRGAKLADVGGKLYLMYAVPGQGQLYTGNTMYMAYEVVGNDIFAAGLLTEGATAPTANHTMDKTFFDTVAIVAGNTNQIIGIEDDPFASFVETYSEEAQLRPWLLDPEFIALQAEAAIENRNISGTEWRLTNWYQTHNKAERDWMDLELSDPAEAARQLNDLEIFYENQLSSLGVSGVPDGLVQWISSKNISGQWSDTYTTEQLKLFSDPYKSGDRDAELQNLISSSGFGDVDRTAAREREVVELYRKWLGPTLGSLTQDEVASIAGRLRDDPDYEDALIQNLKQNRLAAFSNYTNPELTYEDIARPWRNLTTSVWGQTADETQGWWQEMVKSNDFATAQETLRTKGLEQNVTQVTQDATKALQQALGQGQISQLGVNV